MFRSDNDRIQIFDRSGAFIDQIGDLRKPDALAFLDDEVDAASAVPPPVPGPLTFLMVVVAEMDHRVSVLGLDGDVLFRWGDGEADPTPGMFEGAPHGICLDSRHRLYVSEVGVDGRMQRFTYEAGLAQA